MTDTSSNLSTLPFPHLLQLPPELRLKIYHHLLTPQTTPLLITPLFIRTHYKTLFMSQHPKHITTSLLLVCKQITRECLHILYGLPIWRASCRLEQLASQIGVRNFGLIRRMEVDGDDLGVVLGALRREREEDQPVGSTVPTTATFLHFSNLELLTVQGWQKGALTSRGNKASRVEGRSLCVLAMEILHIAPGLNVLVQVGDRYSVGNGGGYGTGGSDARDMGLGRVKWRFLRSVADMVGDEHVVELVEMIALFDALIGMDEADERGSESVSWRGGVFRQYPYLERD